MWEEAQLIVDRLNQSHATEAVLTQSAISACLSKEGNREFKKILKRLQDGKE